MIPRHPKLLMLQNLGLFGPAPVLAVTVAAGLPLGLQDKKSGLVQGYMLFQLFNGSISTKR